MCGGYVQSDERENRRRKRRHAPVEEAWELHAEPVVVDNSVSVAVDIDMSPEDLSPEDLSPED